MPGTFDEKGNGRAKPADLWTTPSPIGILLFIIYYFPFILFVFQLFILFYFIFVPWYCLELQCCLFPNWDDDCQQPDRLPSPD